MELVKNIGNGVLLDTEKRALIHECSWCGNTHVFHLTKEECEGLAIGRNWREVFPPNGKARNMSIREAFISGMCDDYFPSDEEKF